MDETEATVAPGLGASGGVVVRRLDPSDSIAGLTLLLHRSYAPLAAMGLRYVATHQPDEVTRERAGQGECYLALAAGVLVGTILFRPAERTAGCPWYDRPEVASFGQFAVAPEWQSRGLGGRLMDRVEARAAETGAGEIALDTPNPPST